MANSGLANAKNAKNDEFYTQYYDIEKEMNAYLEYNPDVFKDTDGDLQRIYTGTSHRSIGLADDRINSIVYCIYSTIDGRGGIHSNVRRNGFGTWN